MPKLPPPREDDKVEEKAPEPTPKADYLKAPEPPERRPVLEGGHQHWTCPWCGRANGIPERDYCECGAVLVPGGAERV